MYYHILQQEDSIAERAPEVVLRHGIHGFGEGVQEPVLDRDVVLDAGREREEGQRRPDILVVELGVEQVPATRKSRCNDYCTCLKQNIIQKH